MPGRLRLLAAIAQTRVRATEPTAGLRSAPPALALVLVLVLVLVSRRQGLPLLLLLHSQPPAPAEEVRLKTHKGNQSREQPARRWNNAGITSTGASLARSAATVGRCFLPAVDITSRAALSKFPASQQFISSH